ncbi:hypothetical protein OUZ56_024111 [Daphnia magna]|uniref:Uncharacterized protein n=1 Tax=Daphnia magna TaxID=35525 RepID=A0ABR0B061_9CRUS|nr:hypothetical protein OUZ56_024111 [Daphnia magna]
MEEPQAECMIGSGLEGFSRKEVSASSRVLRCSTVASSDFKEGLQSPSRFAANPDKASGSPAFPLSSPPRSNGCRFSDGPLDSPAPELKPELLIIRPPVDMKVKGKTWGLWDGPDLIKDNYPKLGAKGLKVLPVCDSITKKLQEAGYSFSNNKYTGTKPKIKWNNLLAKRKEYAKLISATGSSADVLKKKPSYYDEIELIIATSADNNYDDWDKQMEAEMNLDSDNDGRHKRNPIEDSSSDDLSQTIPPPPKKKRNSRILKSQQLLQVFEKSIENREKARAERDKMKETHFQDHMAMGSRKQDAMMQLIQRALPEEKPPAKREKKSKSRKQMYSSDEDSK